MCKSAGIDQWKRPARLVDAMRPSRPGACCHDATTERRYHFTFRAIQTGFPRTGGEIVQQTRSQS